MFIHGAVVIELNDSLKMYDNTTASSDTNGKPFQSGVLRRAIDPLGPAQASSSNNHLDSENSYVGYAPIQTEHYANAQVYLDGTSPYVSPPRSITNNHTNYDPGRVTFRGSNNPVNAYHVGVIKNTYPVHHHIGGAILTSLSSHQTPRTLLKLVNLLFPTLVNSPKADLFMS